MTRVIALTGGIGSGKSTVAELFAKLGTPIIDADLIARELTHIDQSAYKDIVNHFNEKQILKADQTLNRNKLREIIFEDQKERQWLENLLHPLIQEKIADEIKKVSAPYCIVVIPLLFEVTPYNFIDRILVVDSPEEQQIARVIARDKTNSALIKKILKSQISRQQRISGADDIIVNENRISDLVPQVEKLHRIYSSCY